MEKTVLLLLALGLITFAECKNLNLKNIRRKRGPPPPESERRVVCVKDLGCLDTYPGVQDSVSMFKLMAKDNQRPNSRATIGTEFRWWAPGETAAKVITNQEFDVSGFDAGLKVKIIVHGWNAGNSEWPLTMKDAFMAKEQCNVFIVDWAGGSDNNVYEKGVANTWPVGAEVGHFIVQLVNATGLKVEDIHIIGHSLGAHISGFAGKWVKDRLQKQVGRITGLDPAGPEFYDEIPGERLDKGDAALVDVIHTNWATYRAAGLGLFKAVGHFDFYPNGGDDQPGCLGQAKSVISSAKSFSVSKPIQSYNLSFRKSADKFSCSHTRAILFFIESIESENCKFLADQCTTWKEYKRGKCAPGKEGTLRVEMGYHADEYRQYIDENEHKKFFLKTNRRAPFCKK